MVRAWREDAGWVPEDRDRRCDCEECDECVQARIEFYEDRAVEWEIERMLIGD